MIVPNVNFVNRKYVFFNGWSSDIVKTCIFMPSCAAYGFIFQLEDPVFSSCVINSKGSCGFLCFCFNGFIK